MEKIYSAYDRPPKYVLGCAEGSSKTRQSEVSGTDINKIVARYDRTGFLPQITQPGFYADVSEIGSYREALEAVRAADKRFMSLPARVRAEFDNDAAKFVDFCSDPANEDQMIALGLLPKVEAEKPVVPAA